MLTYVLAVLAACANGLSFVLQRKANKQFPQRENLSPRLVWSLLQEPLWLGGIVALTAGFLLQASALGTGVIVAAVIALAHSPLLSGADSPREDDGDHHEHAPASVSELA